jgi:acyl-CoA synthetase (AMP-forming)/AMP-acid ligase II
MFAWLALVAINAAPAMVNFNLEGKGLVHCIKVSEAKMILIDEEIQDRALMNDEVVGMVLSMVVLTSQLKAEIEALEPGELDESVTAGTDEKSTLALRYTSGTTGFPKCVRTPMSRTYQLVYGKFDEMGLRPGPGGDRWYICMPMCHATAGSTVMACMIMGITLCIGYSPLSNDDPESLAWLTRPPFRKRFSTSNFWREVRDSRATLLVYVGEVCRYLLTNPPTEDDRNHNVRMMYGNGLRPDVWKTFRDRFGIPEISELFGSTEGVITMVNSAKGIFPFMQQTTKVNTSV